MEQISNAAALKELGYGHTMTDLNERSVIEHWLQENHAVHLTYPNVAKLLVQWIQEGMQPMDADYIESIWSSVDVLKVNLS